MVRLSTGFVCSFSVSSIDRLLTYLKSVGGHPVPQKSIGQGRAVPPRKFCEKSEGMALCPLRLVK
jgi:hypothetical protein